MGARGSYPEKMPAVVGSSALKIYQEPEQS
jgi:hypothetical protein